MGIVYKARDTKLERLVALKFLPPQQISSEDKKQRFIHEAKTASALQHNNICAMHKIDETEYGRMFICMDYYQGENLENRIIQSTRSHNSAPVRLPSSFLSASF